MSEGIYFCILILCGICSQGITGTFADEDIRELSNIVRQKRVVNHVQDQDQPMPIQGVPYIVIIRHVNRISCVGSILSHHVSITTPDCVRYSMLEYRVVSGTARTDRGAVHDVIDIKRHFGGHPSRRADGVALLTVDPPFMYGLTTLNIPLHSGPLLQGTLGIISGWGFNYRSNDRGTSIPMLLRSIQVPIIAHRECVNIYRPFNIQISDKDVCTFHPQRHCGHTDGGAPLVIDGHLAGIHLWTGEEGEQNDCRFPDVFVVLQDSAYNQWISDNI